jgi:hypothetical protein
MSVAAPTARGRDLVIGYGAPAISLLVYLVVWLLYRYGPPGVYSALLTGWGIQVWPYPFLDLESVLLAIDCARQGIDVTLPNACMGGGLFQYSPLLLKLVALPVGASQSLPLGLCLDGLFLISLFLLPRPRRWSEFWQLLLVAISSSTVFAIERANIDIAIYLLALCGIGLLLRSAGARLVGYAIVLGAAAIKFYPASLMLLAARERPGRFLAIATVSVAAALLLVVSLSNGLSHVVVRLPQGNPLKGVFAANDVPLVLALLANGNDAQHGLGSAIRIGSMVCLIGVLTVQVRNFVPKILPYVRDIRPHEQMLLVAGSVCIAFCFFAAENNYYRMTFLLLTFPGLWVLGREAKDRAMSRRIRFTSWVMVGLFWSGLYDAASQRIVTAWFDQYDSKPLIVLVIWAVRELLWWWLVGQLVSVVLCFMWDAPILAQLRPRRRATA